VSGRGDDLPRCVLDSNVWIDALTEESERAVKLMDSVLDGNRTTVVSAYIYEEVTVNLEREFGAGSYVDQLQTYFGELMTSPHIDEPATTDILEMDLDDMRTSDTANFLEDVLQIQEKDVPILFTAWKDLSDHVTIYTADEQFSEFNPHSYYLTGIEIRNINQDDLLNEERQYTESSAEIEEAIESIYVLERSLRKVNGNFEFANKQVRNFATTFAESSAQIRSNENIVEPLEEVIDELEQLQWKGAETEDIIDILRNAIIR